MASSIRTKPLAAEQTQAVAEGLIDCDVHPMVKGGLKALLPYMSTQWRNKIEPHVGYAGHFRPGGGRYLNPHGTFANIRDAIPPDGDIPGTDPEFLKKDLLDRNHIRYALMTDLIAAGTTLAATDPDHSAVMASAGNGYVLERFADDRLRFALTVTPYDSALAVAEIKRHGANPYVAAVYIPLPNMRLGNRHFYPIYEAALEFGLPIVAHPDGLNAMFQGAAEFASGMPERYIDRMIDVPQLAMASINSLIMSGTFDRYPSLKVLFIEYGFAWAVPLTWRMDKVWRELRADVPWVKHWPSEYVHDHIRFTTQPLDEPQRQADLDRLIEDYFADNLCFASDYPHWDNDRPGTVLQTLSEETKRKVNFENARATLRL
jgi:predicted TIM-barrel fold metal-dependent hydrolase